MKIATLGYGIEGGGAERQLILIEQFLDPEVELLRLRLSSSDVLFGEKYKVLEFKSGRNELQKLVNNVRFIFSLRKELKSNKIETVISFTTRLNIYSVLSCLFIPTKVIVCERNTLNNPRLHKFWKIIRLVMYPFANALVVQTKSEMRLANRMFPFTRTQVIPNMIPEKLRQQVSVDRPVRLVFVGRKIYQKGFDIGVEAITLIDKELDCVAVTFIGVEQGGETGHERDLERLKTQIDNAGLRGRVTFTPWKERDHIFQDGDVFVLSSRFEGFPNILLEAMSKGVPCVAFDGLARGSELGIASQAIKIARFGDSRDLASCLTEVIRDPQLRAKLAMLGRESLTSYFPQVVGQSWMALLK